VANNVKGTLAIPHAYGRLQFGEDLELHFRTIIGTGANPNVAAVVVIGIEPGWTKKIADGIRETGKPVAGSRSSRRAISRPSARPPGRRRNSCISHLRIPARGMLDQRALGLDQMRRERHHDGPGLLPHGRQHV
jgi:hypothetical protein